MSALVLALSSCEKAPEKVPLKAVIILSSESASLDFTEQTASFNVTIQNPYPGSTLEASATVTWITDVVINDDVVSYRVAENNSDFQRSGKIKLTYAGATKEFSVTQNPDPYNGHECVDLGLSVKWATCNVGASKPEDYGALYQWAGIKDVTGLSINLDWSNCPYHTGSDQYTGWTKYVLSAKSSYWSGTGSPDNKTVLDPSDDVASVAWRGTWRMPTVAEWDELLNIDNCSWTWTSINEIDGYKVQSKKSGYTDKWIFLPAAGVRLAGYHHYLGSSGYYGSSSLHTSDPGYVYSVYFKSGEFERSYNRRYYGQSVRPVSD
ncbi:MAG: hypothetical protein MJY67_04980 [Bacteroidales bacterium]|nr:hypothetical protein [Bacteroidales bacterium]